MDENRPSKKHSSVISGLMIILSLINLPMDLQTDHIC
jgi:hypothetical protein